MAQTSISDLVGEAGQLTSNGASAAWIDGMLLGSRQVGVPGSPLPADVKSNDTLPHYKI